MADPEQLRILKEEGVTAWNRFRQDKPPTWHASLHFADLSSLDLEEASLRRSLLTKADFRGANLMGAALTGADLSGADFREAQIRDTIFTGADLSGANLSGAELRGGALSGADFTFADLRGANLVGAALSEADLTYAKLAEADLSHAVLQSTDLHGADLSGAILSGARFQFCRLTWLDLSRAEGLEAVIHISGSTIGTDTLAASRGSIPEVFLKGCGLADWEVAQAKLYSPELSAAEVTDIQYEVFRLRSTSPIQINPIFLSYTHADSETVDALHDTLQADGIRCWRDKHGLTAGPLEQQIDRAMRINPTVVLVLSEASVNSDWVRWEAEHARKLEREQARGELRRSLCPIALDDAWKDCNWPGWLRSQIQDLYVIPLHELGFDEGYARLKKGLPIYYASQKDT